MVKAYSLDLRKKVISFVLQGNSKRETAKIFGIGEDTIYRWLKRDRADNLAPTKRVDYARKVSDEDLKRYIEAYSDHTLKEIGAGVGLSTSKVWKYLRRLQITRKKRPRSRQNVALRSTPSFKKP